MRTFTSSRDFTEEIINYCFAQGFATEGLQAGSVLSSRQGTYPGELTGAPNTQVFRIFPLSLPFNPPSRRTRWNIQSFTTVFPSLRFQLKKLNVTKAGGVFRVTYGWGAIFTLNGMEYLSEPAIEKTFELTGLPVGEVAEAEDVLGTTRLPNDFLVTPKVSGGDSFFISFFCVVKVVTVPVFSSIPSPPQLILSTTTQGAQFRSTMVVEQEFRKKVDRNPEV